MAGVLCTGNEEEGIEASGVFLGTLQEDMIDTVRRVKKPFVDVFIEKMFFDDADYPLTYVPMFNMVLPLRKGQKVWVKFNQGNHRYPMLWKLASDFDDDSGYMKDYKLPKDGSLVTFPGAEDTTEVFKISDSIWFVSTKSYGILHWGEQCVLLDGKRIITNSSGDIDFKAGRDINMEAGGKYVLQNASYGFKEMMDGLYDILKSFNVVGSSTSQNTGPSTKTQLLLWQNKYNGLLGGKK